MRVLHFFKTYYPDTTGGIEQVIFQLSQGGGAFGVENRVLTLSPDPHPADIQVADHLVHRSKENLRPPAFHCRSFASSKKWPHNRKLCISIFHGQ